MFHLYVLRSGHVKLLTTKINSANLEMLQNPYVLSADPLGSSSGSAISVAANLVAVSLGTETDGSILAPSSQNSVVGIKPSVGLTSRAGVVPISLRQDSVGWVRLRAPTPFLFDFLPFFCKFLYFCLFAILGQYAGEFQILFMSLMLLWVMIHWTRPPRPLLSTYPKGVTSSFWELMASRVRD